MYQEALLGVLLKLCDDVFDKTISVSPVVEETLKALLVVVFVLVSAGDFYIACGVFFLLLLNAKTDTAFWKAMIPVAAVLMVLNYSNDIHIGPLFVYLSAIAAVLYMEDKAFPEETSTKKILFRVFIVGAFSVILANGYIKHFTPGYLVRAGTKAFTSAMFYAATSVVILTLTDKIK